MIGLKIQDYQCENFFESLQSRQIDINQPHIENGFLNEMERFLDIEYFEQIKNTHYFDSIKRSINNDINEILQHKEILHNKAKVTL